MKTCFSDPNYNARGGDGEKISRCQGGDRGLAEPASIEETTFVMSALGEKL